jgi:hypothetical protein
MIRPPKGYVDKTDSSWMAQHSSLLQAPVHRWFAFPHSYSAALVERIIDAWGLGPSDRILDPFVGAGTTVVVAKDRGIPAIGMDISPLSVLVSRVKIADYNPDELSAEWSRARRRIPRLPTIVSPHEIPLIRRAFTRTAWSWLVVLRNAVLSVRPQANQEFFLVAYLRVMRGVCRAVSDGGWLRWTRRRPSGDDLLERMDGLVRMMIADARRRSDPDRAGAGWEITQGDARFLPKLPGKVSAVICSPPYPNRHDYSRVFAPELLLTFCDEDELKQLRYGSFRSHVEARGPARPMNGYTPPPDLAGTLRRLEKAPLTDRRVPSMVEGYFHDSFLVLKALRTHLREGSRLAFVVGNVRHAGVMIEVDEYLAQIATGLGYSRLQSWVIRYRGNSAQQMEKFGRIPARESVVMLRWK